MDIIFNGFSLILIELAICIFIYHKARNFWFKRKRKGHRKNTNGNNAYKTHKYQPKPDYSAEQLRVVVRSCYKKKKLMNKSEFRVFRLLEDEIKNRRGGQRIFAQVSLGEILQAEGAAYRAVNSKRVDILIVDAFGNPELIVEHQGGATTKATRPLAMQSSGRRSGVPEFPWSRRLTRTRRARSAGRCSRDWAGRWRPPSARR